MIIIISTFSYFLILKVFALSKLVYTIHDQSHFVALLPFSHKFPFSEIATKRVAKLEVYLRNFIQLIQVFGIDNEN